MLKGIHALLVAPILAVLAEMGHGDEVAIVDGNFPAAATARRLVHAGGIASPAMLEAVLTLLPLDDFVTCPAAVMTPPEGRPPIIGEFQILLDAAEGRSIEIEDVARADFYRRAATAYAVIATGEPRWWGNILLRKGAFRP
jgi:L-fucose mutarotase